MNFEALKFDRLNEADVREEIIAPLLRHLGYRSGSDNDIIREQSLRYPMDSLGRKKPDRDPLLRGKADYICEAGGRVRWVIEAKAPGIDIGPDEIEQAYTYARHPEVRAVYFCVTNGREFHVYRTDQTPSVGPVLRLPYADLPRSLGTLESLLSPSAVETDFPQTTLTVGEPLAPGLRSIAQIANGRITFRRTVPTLPHLHGMNVSIVSGAIERSEAGSLIAYVDTLAPFEDYQAFNRRFGLDRIELSSADASISTNADNPTQFVNTHRIIVPEGESLLDLATWSHILNPIRLDGRVDTHADVALTVRRLSGRFLQRITFKGVFAVEVHGDFDGHVL